METEKKIFSTNDNNNDNNNNQIENEVLYSRNIPQNQNVINSIGIDNNLSARLMNTKIVRIRPGTACACVTGCKKLIYNINTISRRDDQNRNNENEQLLFFVEEKTYCNILCFGCCVPYGYTFEFFKILNGVKELFSVSQITQKPNEISSCCGKIIYNCQKFIIIKSIIEMIFQI